MADDGTLFVGANFAHVHAYAPDGTPLRGWSVPADGGRFRLQLAGPDRLAVALERTGQLLVYDLEGGLISSTADAEAYARMGDAHDRRIRTGSGATLELTSDGLVRTGPGPPQVLVDLARPPLAWLGAEPIVPLLLLLAAGTLCPVAGAVLTARRPRG